MAIRKQCIGIDISKSTFTACLCQQAEDGKLTFSKVLDFGNDSKGFNQLLRWVKGLIVSDSELVFLMEATGVYYENLAHHLYKIKKRVHVVLPNTSKHYFSSLNVKTKTDAVDARILSQFGIERVHKLWSPPPSTLLQLRNLTRYYVQLQEQKTTLGNISHSKDCAHDIQVFITKSNKKLITEIDKEIERCLKEIKKAIEKEDVLKEHVRKVLTIKGVGLITVATILAETMGFEQFHSSKQLVSYSGYDVVQRESGTSIKGKTRISKKGNRYIRNALYFPAMVACRYNEALKETYIRINKNNKASKMIGQVAIQRKLLVLIYTLWKNDTEFIENYQRGSLDPKTETTQDSSVAELL
ncbi:MULTISPECIES: IS110 family RNA-guided transposase [Sphingobacterium]|uniref:Transposase IS116/IS110/IS902 family n=1 Tax=Sphingobacterium multivorum TaxID=28454 RepID=A0A2X2J5N2_SPHMU|nr:MULTISPECIES: IS110 family transposase [Sphingobacterium]QRQ59447.1 IS110 family transposase [Sphingobacterium multivorum]QRQ60559.1 IS110 family transposase [Sphingobacterium multivorum]QRQ60865.1 IS110 family transposase [Sphingobacterium multivorum]QRQ62605.1 IS110 family transposase [Sphingobacterium multivorum]SPZ85101.1 Transposase IS116/IS110/IS902 family [Sphingobacterium multivorum]